MARAKTAKSVAPPFDAAEVAGAVARKLADAETPLAFADVKKGLPGLPKKAGPQMDEFDAVVRRALNGVQHYPSGKDQTERYWGRDEEGALRDAALAAAQTPQPVSKLVAALKKAFKATPEFIEGVVRGLIGVPELHEYAPKKKGGEKLFGSEKPRQLPPLERDPYKKKLETAIAGLEKLLHDSGASPADLLRAIQLRLGVEVATAPQPPPDRALPDSEVEALILSKLGRVGPGGVESIAKLRQAMPEAAQGAAFDAAIFRLVHAKRVMIYQDSDPAALSASQKAEYLPDEHGHVFKTIALRGNQ